MWIHKNLLSFSKWFFWDAIYLLYQCLKQVWSCLQSLWCNLLNILTECLQYMFFFLSFFLFFFFLLRKISPDITSVPIFLHFICGLPPQQGWWVVLVHALDPNLWTQATEVEHTKLNPYATGPAPGICFVISWFHPSVVQLFSIIAIACQSTLHQ